MKFISLNHARTKQLVELDRKSCGKSVKVIEDLGTTEGLVIKYKSYRRYQKINYFSPNNNNIIY